MVVRLPTSSAIADAEADAPAWHRVALRDGEELDRHIARARHLEDARRRVHVVEAQVGVRQVGDDPQLLAPGQRHDLLVEAHVGGGRRGVVREVHHQPDGGARRSGERALDLGVVVQLGTARDRNGLTARDDHAESMDRVAGIGRQDAVARADERQQQVGEPFLRADGHHRLAVWVERLSEAAAVPVADRLTRFEQSLRRHVALAARPARLRDQALHGGGGAGAVGVTETEVEDVVSFGAQAGLELVDSGEHVRGKRGESSTASRGRRGAGHGGVRH